MMQSLKDWSLDVALMQGKGLGRFKRQSSDPILFVFFKGISPTVLRSLCLSLLSSSTLLLCLAIYPQQMGDINL